MNEQLDNGGETGSTNESVGQRWELSPARTDVHTAARLEFAGRAVQLPGVEVLLDGNTLTAIVPGLRSPAADAVFALEGELYSAHPNARLNLEVVDAAVVPTVVGLAGIA